MDSPEKLDYIIVDFDPSDNDFSKAIDAALATKAFLAKHKIKCFAKTSGKTGMHIYIPCTAFDFSSTRTIAENICHAVHQQLPSITTTEISIDQRGNKLYLDPNQNDFSDTVAAPYSVRPANHPTVTTPLEWKEIKHRLSPEVFTIDNIALRVQKKGDLFSRVTDSSIAKCNDAALAQLL